ncbi:MAG TPA: hypothetical protein VMV86_03410 [Methanosarcinales archaeon]|nr:hypothetical protein [Methanosarcinales archaeon]
MAKDSSAKVLAEITLTAENKVLTTAEAENKYLIVTTGHATNAIIAPCIEGMNFILINQDTVNNAIIKVSGLTGVTISPSTNDKVYCNGTDYVLVSNLNEVNYV